jgi:hypothetical protein
MPVEAFSTSQEKLGLADPPTSEALPPPPYLTVDQKFLIMKHFPNRAVI